MKNKTKKQSTLFIFLCFKTIRTESENIYIKLFYNFSV